MATVTGIIKNSDGTNYNGKVYFEYTTSPLQQGDTLIVSKYVTANVVDGILSVELETGGWRVIVGRGATPFLITVPSDLVVGNIAALVSPCGGAYYSDDFTTISASYSIHGVIDYASQSFDSERLGGKLPNQYSSASHLHTGVYEPVFSKGSVTGGYGINVENGTDRVVGYYPPLNISIGEHTHSVDNVDNLSAYVASIVSTTVSASVPATSSNAVNSATASIALDVRDKTDLDGSSYINIYPTGTGILLGTTPYTVSLDLPAVQSKITASRALVANTATTATSSLTSDFSEVSRYSDSSSYSYTSLTADFAEVSRYADIATTASYADYSSNAGFASLASSAANAAFADSSSVSITSSYLNPGTYAITASHASNSDFAFQSANATVAAYAITAGASNTAISASYAPSNGDVSIITGSTFNITSSVALNAVSASYAKSASVAVTASYFRETYQTTTTSSIYASSSISASHARSASYALTATTAGTASYAWNSNFTNLAITAANAGYAESASYAKTASYLPLDVYAITASNASVASHALQAANATVAAYAITAGSSDTAISASYAPFTDTNTWLTTGSTYPITASVAVKAITANLATTSVSASFASRSFSGSHALFANTASHALTVKDRTNLNGGSYITVSPTATNVLLGTSPITISLDISALQSAFTASKAVSSSHAVRSDSASYHSHSHAGQYEPVFSKGNLTQGTGIVLSGTTTSRLVGVGNVTVSVSPTLSASYIKGGASGYLLKYTGSAGNEPTASDLYVIPNGIFGSRLGFGTTDPIAFIDIVGRESKAAIRLQRRFTSANQAISFVPTDDEMVAGSSSYIIGQSNDDFRITPYPPGLNNSVIYLKSGSSDGFRLGIKTENPQATMHVIGNVIATSFTGSLSGNATSATTATSASFAPINPFASASLVTQLATKQPNLVTGASYNITASWAVNVVNGNSGSSGTTISTGSTYPITASFANKVTGGTQDKMVVWGSADQLTSAQNIYNYELDANHTYLGFRTTKPSASIHLVEYTSVGGIILQKSSDNTQMAYTLANTDAAMNAGSQSFIIVQGNANNNFYLSPIKGGLFGAGGTINSSLAWISSSTGYNVGLFETNPTAKFEVAGNVKADSFTGSLLGNASTAISSTISDTSLYASSSNTALTASSVTIANISTDANSHIPFASETGTQSPLKRSSDFTFNSSTRQLNVYGNVDLRSITNANASGTGDIGESDVLFGNVYATNFVGTASYSTLAQSALFATSALSASYAPNMGGSGASVTTGSTYPITASYALKVVGGTSDRITLFTGSDGSSLTASQTIYHYNKDSQHDYLGFRTSKPSASIHMVEYTSVNGIILQRSSVGTQMALTFANSDAAMAAGSQSFLMAQGSTTNHFYMGPLKGGLFGYGGAFNSGLAWISSSAGYNVGLHTTNPSAKFEVSGNVKATSFTGSLLGTASISSFSNRTLVASNALTSAMDIVLYDGADMHVSNTLPFRYTPAFRQLLVTNISASTITGSLLGNASTATTASYVNNRIQYISLACSDETSSLSVGTKKITIRTQYAGSLVSLRASLTSPATGALVIVDVNKNGTSVLSTKLTIDENEYSSKTAATPVVIFPASASFADDDEFTIDIDQVGSTGTGKGLKVYLKTTES